MGSTCIWTPGINEDLSGEPSALHPDLVEYTGDRALANAIYAAAKIGLLDKSKLKFDEKGEPTLESVIKQIPVRGIIAKTSLIAEKRELGAIDRNNNPIPYDSLEEVLVKVNDFNKQNPELVAFPTRQDKKFFINVEYKNEANYTKPQEAAFNSQLNNSLLGIMKRLGFTAINDNEVTGIFDPLNAMSMADGLKAVIRISEGKLGEEAFPEEFSHLMIEGLQDHPLVVRILNSLNSEEALRKVLGDEYDRYAAIYTENGTLDQFRLQKEAAGKLLQKHIVGEELLESPVPRTLLGRLWNFIKGLFSNIHESDIDSIINEVNRNTVHLASIIKDESVLPYFNVTKVMDGKALYKLSKELKSMQDISEEILEVASRRLKIIQARSKDSDKDIKKMIEEQNKIKALQEEIDKKKYKSSCVAFLQDTVGQLEEIQEKLDNLGSEVDSSNLVKLRKVASVLREVKEFSDGYVDVIDIMRSLPLMAKRGDVELNDGDAKDIASKAKEVSGLINDLKLNYIELRYRVVYEFLKTYWGEDKTWDIGKDKGKTLTLAGILDMAEKDIGFVDRLVSSMSDASDPLLSLIDKSVKVTRAKRDIELEDILANCRAAHKKLRDAGESTKFMYELDSNGIPTGRIISDINFAKFNEDREKEEKRLRGLGLKPWQVKNGLEKWDRRHTVEISIDIDEDKTRLEVVPKGLRKGDPYYIDRLSKLNTAQREYYETMRKLKADLDRRLPSRYVSAYNAIQIRNDILEGVSQSRGPVEAAKAILSNVTDNFIRRVDNTEYGEMVEGDEEKRKVKNVTLDFSGNPIQKLPIFYVRPLEDMRRLSTDFTASMLAYAGMAVDYDHMSKIVDILELARDLVHDREVKQYSGDQKIEEAFRVLHKKFSRTYTKKGGNIAKRLDNYMDTVFYGRKKVDEGTWNILGKQVDVAQTLDSIKSYSGAVGLGLNIFSGMSNVTVGKMQIFIDAVAGEYFGYKNSIVGKKNYYALLPTYLGEINSTTKSNKLALLIDKYDALEEFHDNVGRQGLYKGALGRAFRNTGLYILNNLGEHYLHSRTMLAMLDRHKVKVNGKETSLFDAWKVISLEDDNGKVVSYKLVLKNGTKALDGSELYTEAHEEELARLRSLGKKKTDAQRDRMEELREIKNRTDELNINLKLEIGKVNQSLNGAFNEADKGAVHRYALGRMAMQFRQWMPAHYSRRFAHAYYDAQLDQFREGYYRTFGRFLLNIMRDVRYLKFQWGTRFSQLSVRERQNFIRATSELAMFGLLSLLCSMLGHWKDRKGNLSERLALYNLKRAQLETGASVPWPFTFLQNMWTILQSPAAALKTFENFTNLLQFQNMFNEVQSGIYKGWSEWERDAVKAAPVIGQIKKFTDISEEDYMFNIFDK